MASVRDYTLVIETLHDPRRLITIGNMPAILPYYLFPIYLIYLSPGVSMLMSYIPELINILDQLEISFQLAMLRPETMSDEFVLNKLKTIIALILKIEAIIAIYNPGYQPRDLSRFD
jgi:hypothetical protein